MSASTAGGSPALRVAVVDDHLLVAEGIASLLQAAGHDVVLVASRWSELTDSGTLPLDVVVIDLHLEDGVLIGTKVRALAESGTAAVVISHHADASSIGSAMRAGANGFVAKADPGHELLTAVTTAADGGNHLAEHHAKVVEHSDALPGPRLGRQEERALVLYAGGHSIREVAGQMHTTEETVKSYVKRARRKYREVGIDIGTRVLLRRFAMSQGWFAAT